MPELTTGIITFDRKGHHWLETFEGRFTIDDQAFADAWAIIEQQGATDELETASVYCRLARGRVVDERVTDLSYLVDGKEYPQR